MKRGIALIILTLNVLIWCNSLLGADSSAFNKDYATKEDIRTVIKLLEETKGKTKLLCGEICCQALT